MPSVEITYECCEATYKFPVAIGDYSLLLANAGLGDTLIMHADAMHDTEHPECLENEEDNGEV